MSDRSEPQKKTAPRVVRRSALAFEPRFAYGEQARIAEVSGTRDGTRLGTGFARFRNAKIPWTTRYDEVLLVLDGRVTVHCGEQVLEAGKCEAVWLPAGTELVYEAQDAQVFYAIWPADWADGTDSE